jgi:hypothetical protein
MVEVLPAGCSVEDTLRIELEGKSVGLDGNRNWLLKNGSCEVILITLLNILEGDNLDFSLD